MIRTYALEFIFLILTNRKVASLKRKRINNYAVYVRVI